MNLFIFVWVWSPVILLVSVILLQLWDYFKERDQ